MNISWDYLYNPIDSHFPWVAIELDTGSTNWSVSTENPCSKRGGKCTCKMYALAIYIRENMCLLCKIFVYSYIFKNIPFELLRDIVVRYNINKTGISHARCCIAKAYACKLAKRIYVPSMTLEYYDMCVTTIWPC